RAQPSRESLPVRDVVRGRDAIAADLVGGERADDLRRYAHDQRPLGYVAPLGHQRPGSDDAVVADTRTIEDDGSHADEGVVADSTAMHDGAMSDGAAAADRDWAAGVGVDDRQLLQIALRADDDRLAVAAQDRAEPNANVLAELDFADQARRGRNPEAAF